MPDPESGPPPEPGASEPLPAGDRPVPRQSRRLSDKILVAFHQACDQQDLEVAEQLLRVVETLLHRPAAGDPNRRRSLDSLVAAHERLWHLRQR